MRPRTWLSWSEAERAVLLEYADWRKGLHSCGHHLADSMIDPSRPKPHPPVFQAHLEVCAGCLEIEAAQHAQAKADKKAADKGDFVPRIARMWRAVLIRR